MVVCTGVYSQSWAPPPPRARGGPAPQPGGGRGAEGALQALDEDIVHVTEECLHGLRTMLGSQVLPEALKHPLATLRPR